MNSGVDRERGSRTVVLVNLCWLVPGVVGGSEEATTNAIRALIEFDPPDIDLRLAVLRPFVDAHPDIAAAIPCEILESDGSNKVRRVFSEQVWLARLTERVGATVVHHAGGIVPLVHPARTVLTIHDLQPLDMSENFAWPKRTYMRLMLGRSARAADVVCVPSAFTRSRVEELLSVPAGEIVETPWCLPRPPESLPDGPSGEAPVAQRGRYLLYPAITYPHKRHILLLNAFAMIADEVADVDLVLTGGAGPIHDEVIARIETLGLRGRVDHLGRVSETELIDLYRGARAVVLPSAYEGFGMPALEAMSYGCPVIASSRGSLSEVVVADGLVEGDDPASWGRAITRVLSLGAEERSEWVRAGLELAGSFTPERTASALVDAYRLASRGESRPRGS